MGLDAFLYVCHHRLVSGYNKALPESAPAKPKQARKLLVYSRTAGFRHPSIPVGVRAITLMGDKTGAYFEIYQFKLDSALPAERKFLLVLDTAKMPDANRGNRKADGPYPISWVGTYGKGRTFYCSLGHREEIYCNPAILKHYLAGIQYVLGDLDADATPTCKPVEDRK